MALSSAAAAASAAASAASAGTAAKALLSMLADSKAVLIFDRTIIVNPLVPTLRRALWPIGAASVRRTATNARNGGG
jgi:hypothetical protein